MPEEKDSEMGKQHHDARPLTKEEAQQLYEHLRAVEALNAEIKDIQEDKNERITLCCEVLPINKDVFDFVIKRRKAGRGVCGNFDQMLELVEEAVQTVEAQRRDAGPPAQRETAPVDGRPHEDDEQPEGEGEDDEASVNDDADDEPPFVPDEPDSAFVDPRQMEPADPF